MALNFPNNLKLKAPSITTPATRVAKLVAPKMPKSLSFNKVQTMKNVIQKPVDFTKMTKMPKLPKAPKIAIIKKAIKKAAKPKGF